MNLFISYSRDDKAWVYELWRALRDRGNHDAWIDQQLVPAQDWWETILHHIEICECVVYIMTPRSVDSIFCNAEIGYALALNKPIAPLMLKQCDYPTELRTRRIQYQPLNDAMTLSDTMYMLERGLGEIRLGRAQNKFPAQEAPRPPEPHAEKQSDQELEVFLLAEGAAAENNFSLAEKHYQQVITIDPRGWGLAAAERLAEIRMERDRGREYLTIYQMMTNPVMIKGARAAARVYMQKYGAEYDPHKVLTTLLEPVSVPAVMTTTPTPIPKTDNGIHIQIPKTVLIPPDPPPGTRITDPKDSKVTLVYVPAGSLKMGSEDGLYDNEQPINEVEIANGFWLDLIPVTNAMYGRFIKDGGYSTRRFWTEAGWEMVQSHQKKGPVDYDGFTEPKQPRVGVTWFEAYAYCRWRGGRLPTEAEWEWAARGPQNRKYPWGEIFDPNRVIYKENSGSVTDRVGDGVRMQGASWVGALDMSGNVWEWVNSLYRPYPYDAHDGRESNTDGASKRALRGGSWYFFDFTLRSAFRVGDVPFRMNYSVGFRCVRSF